jgi:predicted dehydrogenase
MGLIGSPDRKLRLGIVGIDHYHTTGWVESLELFADRLEVVALYDPDPAIGGSLAPRWHDPNLSPRLADRYRKSPFVTDLDELIADHRLDLALVTLPNAVVPDAIARLAAAGIHMLVDKPGATNADAAASALAVARDNNVRVAVGLLRRYGRGWQHARDLITSGRAGRVMATEAVFNTSSVFVRDPANHLFSRRLQGGGILLWLGVHDVDQLLWLTGQRIVEVQAMAGQVSGAEIDVEDAISIALRYENGALGTVHYAYVLPRPMSDGYLAVRGERGSVSVAFDGTVRWIGAGTASDPVTEETLTTGMARMPGYGSLAPLLIEDWLASIAEQRDPLAGQGALVSALRVIEAAYESAATGKRIRVRH